MLQCLKPDSGLVMNIITGNETWVYASYPQKQGNLKITTLIHAKLKQCEWQILTCHKMIQAVLQSLSSLCPKKTVLTGTTLTRRSNAVFTEN